MVNQTLKLNFREKQIHNCSGAAPTLQRLNAGLGLGYKKKFYLADPPFLQAPSMLLDLFLQPLLPYAPEDTGLDQRRLSDSPLSECRGELKCASEAVQLNIRMNNCMKHSHIQ